jgi:hypothetical protein
MTEKENKNIYKKIKIRNNNPVKRNRIESAVVKKPI